MKLNKIIMGLATVTLLAGCGSSLNKVTFKEFHDAAVKAAEAGHDFTKADVSLKLEMEGQTLDGECKLENKGGMWAYVSGDATVANMALNMNVEAIDVPEDDIATYYYTEGKGFKVEVKEGSNSAVMEFNAEGLCTYIDESSEGVSGTLKISYSK